MTKIKICGITRFEDAQTCADNGVDFIGINFYPDSPRFVSTEQARLIIYPFSKLKPKIKFVGVFVNSSFAKITETAAYCGLDIIQLHGDEEPQLLTQLRSAGLPTFKAFRGTGGLGSIGKYLVDQDNPDLPQLLLDAYQSNLYGGTGKTLDQDEILQLRKILSDPLGDKSLRILLAGGLKPDNVTSFVRAIQPWGVDCASGVEANPGIKDPEKIRLFCSRVRAIKPAKESK